MDDASNKPQFWIDRTNFVLWRAMAGKPDEAMKLPRKTFDVLCYLVENAGRLVSQDEILEALWQDVHVQPEVIKGYILAIRAALGDNSSSPRYIETQRGRGYRFVGKIGVMPVPSVTFPQKPDAKGLVGREQPLQVLREQLLLAMTGAPQVAFVSGEPGIGKTALVEQFLAESRALVAPLVAEGHCIEGFAGREPYYLMLEVFADLCRGPAGPSVQRALVDLAPMWAIQMPAQIPAELRLALPSQLIDGASSRMVREASQLLETISAGRLLVLVLEDLHWSDFATIDCLSAICRRRMSAKLMVIATFRPEDAATARHPLVEVAHELAFQDYCREIELGPLTDAAIVQFLGGDVAGQPISPDLKTYITERTGGNPLFMGATLDYLHDIGVAAQVDGGWRLLKPLDGLAHAAPPSLSRMIARRLDRLSADKRRVLDAASITGQRFETVVVAKVLDMDEHEFEAICEELAERDRLVHRTEMRTAFGEPLDLAYTFNHAVYRHVLNDRLGPIQRARLHRMIGQCLEALCPPDRRDELAVRLAAHFAEAREWVDALRYQRVALNLANRRFARRDALAILERADELAIHLPANDRTRIEAEILERRAALLAARHDPGAADAYRRLVAASRSHHDIDMETRAWFGLSRVLSWHDRAACLTAVDEILRLSEAQTNPAKRDLALVMAYMRRLWVRGWSRSDARLCEEAFSRVLECDDARTIGQAKTNFGMVCIVSSRYREARDLLVDGFRLVRGASHAHVESDLSRLVWIQHIIQPWPLLSLGDFGSALTAFDASIGLIDSDDDPFAEPALRVYRSIVLFHVLDFDGVLSACAPIARRAIDNVTTDIADPMYVLPIEVRIAMILCGLAEMGLGHVDRASGYLDAAVAEMMRQPIHLDWYWGLLLDWALIDRDLLRGNTIAAVERGKRLCALADETDERLFQALAREGSARAERAAGQSDQAREAIERGLDYLKAGELPLAAWRLHAVAARIFADAGLADRAQEQADLGSAVRQKLAASLSTHPSLRGVFERRSAAIATIDERPAVTSPL